MTYRASCRPDGRRARVLVVPGLGDAGEGHWQSIWEKERGDCRKVDLGRWSDPLPAQWIHRIDDAVWHEAVPAVLVAHGLGCIAVAHWAARHGEATRQRVIGALLVAPCDPAGPGAAEAERPFRPVPRAPLPFSSVVVASATDDRAPSGRAQDFSQSWHSAFLDAGNCGRIDADSGLGAWLFGQLLLERLLAEGESLPPPRYGPGGRYRSPAEAPRRNGRIIPLWF